MNAADFVALLPLITIAATAIVHDMILVTRNTRDVADTAVRCVNPWQ